MMFGLSRICMEEYISVVDPGIGERVGVIMRGGGEGMGGSVPLPMWEGN